MRKINNKKSYENKASHDNKEFVVNYSSFIDLVISLKFLFFPHILLTQYNLRRCGKNSELDQLQKARGLKLQTITKKVNFKLLSTYL